MKKTAIAVIALATTSAFAGPMDFKGKMKEGLYEMTTNVEMTGVQMPQGMKIPSTTIQRCVTREDVDKGNSAVLGQQGPRGKMPEDCAVKDFSMNGDTATYKMACTGDKQMAMDGSVTFTGAGYHGVNHMTMNQGGKQMNMTMTFDSKYLGACTK